MISRIRLSSIKVLPFAMLGLAFASSVELAVIIFDIQSLEVKLTAQMFAYLFALLVYFCVYRLTNIFKGLSYASVMFMLFAITSIFDNVAQWLYRLFDGYRPFMALSYLFGTVPDTCVLLAVAFILRCMYGEYKAMDMPDKSVTCDKMLRLWIIAEIAQILIIDVMLQVHRLMGGPFTLMADIVVYLTGLFYFVTAVAGYIVIRGFCYDYYMFAYNNRGRY